MSPSEQRAVRLFSPLLAAAAVGASVFATWWLSRDANAEFQKTPQFLIWVLLFSTQLAIWIAGYVIVGRDLVRLWPTGRWRGWAKIIAGPLWAVLAFLGFSLSIVPTYGFLREEFPFTPVFERLPDGREWPLVHQTGRLTGLTLVAIGLALLAVLGMFLVRSKLLEHARRTNVTDQHLTDFLTLRGRMLRLLAVVGLAIGIGTLVIGALKQAMDAAAPSAAPRVAYCDDVKGKDLETLAYCEGVPKPKATARTIDDQFIVLFGLYYSGLLMLAFAPVYLAFLTAGKNLVRRTVGDSDPFLERQEKRKKLEDALQLNVSAATTFKSSVAVFAPLFGSLVSLLLGSG